MTKTKFEKGLELRRDMFGPEGAEKQVDAASGFLWPMQEFVTEACFGTAWQRDHLDRKQRSMLTLAMLLAMGRTPELKTHVKGAIANGVSMEEIREIFMHGIIYCGLPAGVSAFRAASEVFQQLGLDEGEQPPRQSREDA